MALETTIHKISDHREILLMTHVVLGYPSFEEGFRVIETMVKAGVDLMELQIPFSDPMADGPVILKANQTALDRGATVQDCLDFAGEAALSFDIPFLIMTYYNIPFVYGLETFASALAQRNLQGCIIPDLPPEEASEYIEAMGEHRLAPIFTFSPKTSHARMKTIATHARGFIYCMARKGVTGAHTAFDRNLSRYLSRCRKATRLPLALGFGVQEPSEVHFLRGKCDIAVVGTRTIQLLEEGGVEAVEVFIRSLR